MEAFSDTGVMNSVLIRKFEKGFITGNAMRNPDEQQSYLFY